MLARLAATPVELIVAQFAVQLQELGVLHLGIAPERPESLGQAALAIDALGALVEGLGERLAPNDEPLRQVLAQLRLAYVEVANDPRARGVARDACDARSGSSATRRLRRPARGRDHRGQRLLPEEGVLGPARRGRRHARARRHDARRRAHHVRLHRPVPLRHPSDPGRGVHDQRHARDRARARSCSTSGAPYNLQWFFTAEDETRTFDISYTVTGAAVGAPDVAELYWKWVGEDHPTIGLVTATLHVPPGAGALQAWGHGPLTGVVRVDGRHRALARARRPAGDVRGGSRRDPAGPDARAARDPAARGSQQILREEQLVRPRRERRARRGPPRTRARERDAA